MKKAAALLVMLHGICFADSPAWLSSPDLTVDVKWTRSATSPGFLHAGICHLFFSDSSERAMWPAEEQIERCAAQSKAQNAPLTTDAPTPGAVRLFIWRVSDNLEVERRWGDLYGNRARGIAKGFAHVTPNGCAVVVNGTKSVIGHEIKHCYDGKWHR